MALLNCNTWEFEFEIVGACEGAEVTNSPNGRGFNHIEVKIPLTSKVKAQLVEHGATWDSDYEPVGKAYKDKDTDKWHQFVNEHHERATIASGEWEVKTIYVKKEKQK